jgi:predicted nicotinamide N-methyase
MVRGAPSRVATRKVLDLAVVEELVAVAAAGGALHAGRAAWR